MQGVFEAIKEQKERNMRGPAQAGEKESNKIHARRRRLTRSGEKEKVDLLYHRVDRSARVNRLAPQVLQKVRYNNYTLGWHLAAWKLSIDSVHGGSTEQSVCARNKTIRIFYTTPPQPTPPLPPDSHQTTTLPPSPPNPPAAPFASTFPGTIHQNPDQKPGEWQFYA